MLAKMFLFEWRYFVRQPSFYVTSLIFFLLTFFATVSENIQIGGGGNVLYNGPFSIAQTLLIMGIFAMFLVVNFVASTATRNDTSRMSELLYSKPINPLSYQLGRFLGSFSIVATVFLFVPLGILLGTLIGGITGWVDPERLGVTDLTHYITSYFYLSLPTLLVLSCFFYAVAIRFRSMMAVYLSAVAVFILYVIAGQFASEPEYRTLAALLDPFASNTFREVTRYWTMFDKNNAAIEMTGILLQNRLIWLGIAAFIMVFFAGFRSKVRLEKVKATNKSKKTEQVDFSELLKNDISYKSSGIQTFAHLLLRTKFEIKQVVFSAPFLVLGALTVFLLVAPLIDPQGMFGTPNWPLTQAMVTLIQNSTELLIMIVLAYYSAEIVWRERNSGMGDIIDSMPVNNVTFWFSKIIAMGLIITLLYAFGMFATMANQALNGYDNFEVSQYIVRLGYINLLPLMMVAVLAFFLQVVSPNKYVGMMLFVLFIISTITLSNFGFSHNMFQFAGAPRLLYSDINGYGDFLTSHSWYMLYWGGFTLILGALGYALWHRGPAQSLKMRIKNAGYYLGTPGKTAIALGLIVFIATGSYIHYNTRVLNEYVIQDDREELQAEYEKKYSTYLNADIPTITKTHAKIDIYPSIRKIDAVADIVVSNTSNKPIERFLVSKPAYTEKWNVTFIGGKLGEVDDKFDTAWFQFDKPLMPGEIRSGKLSAVRSHQGFSDGNNDFSLIENGTFINNFELFPVFGYQQTNLLTDRHKRRKYGLEPLQRANKLEDKRFYNESFFGKGVGFIDFNATISTSEDQFAIAPGYLQSEEVKNGRRIFHYKMDAPMVNFYSVMSARLEAKKEQYKGINIEVYYHKTHAMNVARMFESVRDSIDYFTENFGEYQHKQMRIIEFPGYRSFAQSFANTVPYSEQIGFITDLRDPDNIDPVYYVTAHEVAHQWWGHQVGAANVQGSAIISESLSQYSALMVMEKKYGTEKIRKFLKYELDRYLRGRTVEFLEEMPLIRSENQQYIHYRKGSVVMMSLKDRLGETRLNKALNDFLKKYKYQSKPCPTTLDLVAFITQDTDQQEKAFVSNLFEHISLYDLKTTNVKVVKAEGQDDFFDVTLTIEAALNRADGQGKETAVEFTDLVDIGLFSEDPENLGAENFVIYLQKHQIKTGTNEIKLHVKGKPKFAGVDPFVKLVDKDGADNIYRL
ncbi:ABC transporter permease/M1 family aminopeptidase [Pseudoalteromonas denitrificans]|uniref:ABC-2 type transport system permease protein n=1 Tax=Pseudoalteromonas denitrificans DSM 6059 TaxID=1123010 RepID=A0A1I1SAD4_9GAMM|nr:M1 family aminopeptidase [Pseudoalteromonas denitrificans]SFD39950.1 ABC-2 type transport system permease protein [Pseudoalteromonas denitrificans DSM 6059]